MGLGRDQVFIQGFSPMYYKKQGIPGPGTHEIAFNRTSVGTKFGKATIPALANSKFPGPGQYKIPTTVTDRGQFLISKYKWSGAPRIPLTSSSGRPTVRFEYRPSRKAFIQRPKHHPQAITRIWILSIQMVDTS